MKKLLLKAIILSAVTSSVVLTGIYTVIDKSPILHILADTTNTGEQVAFSDLYHNFRKAKHTVQLDVPTIKQFPELPRGCEVTALAMLLNAQGYQTPKMELAKKIRKDPTPYQEKNGSIYFGNPHNGFVGSIYNRSKPGLGVYVEPIIDLAYEYAGTNVINLTKQKELELMFALSEGTPVWIITNTTYKKLPASAFETWETPQGKIKITYKEHSVVITGYDNDYYYFNDPLDGKQKKAAKDSFIEAWEQMGAQAITILPKNS